MDLNEDLRASIMRNADATKITAIARRKECATCARTAG